MFRSLVRFFQMFRFFLRFFQMVRFFVKLLMYYRLVSILHQKNIKLGKTCTQTCTQPTWWTKVRSGLQSQLKRAASIMRRGWKPLQGDTGTMAPINLREYQYRQVEQQIPTHLIATIPHCPKRWHMTRMRKAENIARRWHGKNPTMQMTLRYSIPTATQMPWSWSRWQCQPLMS